MFTAEAASRWWTVPTTCSLSKPNAQSPRRPVRRIRRRLRQENSCISIEGLIVDSYLCDVALEELVQVVGPAIPASTRMGADHGGLSFMPYPASVVALVDLL